MADGGLSGGSLEIRAHAAALLLPCVTIRWALAKPATGSCARTHRADTTSGLIQIIAATIIKNGNGFVTKAA